MTTQEAVLAALPDALRKSFEDSDEQAMKEALGAMTKAEKDQHWDKIVSSGLWSPNKVWKKPIPKKRIASTGNVAGDQKEDVVAKFSGPLGLTLIQNVNGKGTVVQGVDARSPSEEQGVVKGMLVVSVNGQNVLELKKSECVNIIKNASTPKTVVFRHLPQPTPAPKPASLPSHTAQPVTAPPPQPPPTTTPTVPNASSEPVAPPPPPTTAPPAESPVPGKPPPPPPRKQAQASAPPTVPGKPKVQAASVTPTPAPPATASALLTFLALVLIAGGVVLLATTSGMVDTSDLPAVEAVVEMFMGPPPPAPECRWKFPRGCVAMNAQTAACQGRALFRCIPLGFA